MQTFNVTCRDGGRTEVRAIVADTAENARLVAECNGAEVIGNPVAVRHPVESRADVVAPSGIPHIGGRLPTIGDDEWRIRLTRSALRLVVLGIVIPPFCWIGMVLAVVADTKTSRIAWWLSIALIFLHVIAWAVLTSPWAADAAHRVFGR